MKVSKIVGLVLVVIMLAGLILAGTSCSGEGPSGVGIESIINNGDGTFTLNLTDGSSFTTANLTGPQGVTGATGAKGDKGDTGAQGPVGAQMTAPWGGDMQCTWNQSLGALVITPPMLPEILGSGFSYNTTVEIYLVVAPTSRILVATLTTNGIGCFYADLTQINTGRDPIQVAPSPDLDQAGGMRACCFEGGVDGQVIATLPIVTFGLSLVGVANSEVASVETAALAYYADNGAFPHDTNTIGANNSLMDPPGSQTAYITGSAVYNYHFDNNGQVVVPDGTAWPADPNVTWDVATHKWVIQ